MFKHTLMGYGGYMAQDPDTLRLQIADDLSVEWDEREPRYIWLIMDGERKVIYAEELGYLLDFLIDVNRTLVRKAAA